MLAPEVFEGLWVRQTNMNKDLKPFDMDWMMVLKAFQKMEQYILPSYFKQISQRIICDIEINNNSLSFHEIKKILNIT